MATELKLEDGAALDMMDRTSLSIESRDSQEILKKMEYKPCIPEAHDHVQ